MSDAAIETNASGNSSLEQGSVVPLGWKPTSTEPVPVVRCVQIKKDGHRCGRWSLRGYTKCYVHAGPGRMKDGNVAKYAEAVQEAARLRLIDSSDMALDCIEELIKPGTSEQIRLKAATEVLDRAGIRGGFDVNVDVQVTTNPSETIEERLKALAEGAKTVKDMREGLKKEQQEEHDAIMDAEIVPDDDDGQEALF